MTFDPKAEFNSAVNHMARLAMTPGWWQYTRAEVARMDADKSGLWRGLRAAVGERIKEAGYKPPPHDLLPMEPYQVSRLDGDTTAHGSRAG